MYCPQCRSEYLEGVKECADCKVPLVDKLPPLPGKKPDSRLKYLALFVICGIIWVFVSRIIGTFFPGVFRILAVTRISIILSFLASLAHVLFFSFFITDYAKRSLTGIKRASLLALTGSALMLILQTKGIPLVFSRVHLSFLLHEYFIEPLIPWVSSILILIFFIIFYRELYIGVQSKLKKAVLFAVIGSAIGTFLKSFILYMYISSRTIRWFSDLPKATAITFFPIVIFGFISVLYFYLVFYRLLKKRY